MFNKKIKKHKLKFFLALLFGCTSIGWIDPLADKVREGNEFYQNGKYDEALDKYVDAQINSPNTPEVNFNMADVQYKRGKFNEASQLFQKVIESNNVEMKAKSSFNMGNTLYRQGKMKEALECYKKTVDYIDGGGHNSSESDALKNNAKYNYEYVEKKMKEQLQKQQNQEQKDQQQKADHNKKDEQSDENKGENKEKQESQEDKQPPTTESHQEKSEDKKDERPDHPEKDNQKEQPAGQQQQPQPQGQKQMSKEEAERLLEALNHSEKEARSIKRNEQRPHHRSVEKDW